MLYGRSMPHRAKAPCLVSGCNKLKPCPIHHKERQKERDRVKPMYYKWYYSKAWKTLRTQQLRAHPYCRDCMNTHHEYTIANEVDHIQEHRGDVKLFFNKDNLQSLCKPCHSRKTSYATLNREKIY